MKKGEDQNAISHNDLTPGVVKLERVRVTCPACGQEVDAVASDGRVKGYCAVAKRYVDFLIEAQRVDDPTPETLTSSGVVSDYLAGDKIVNIQKRYGISPGRMYRRLHTSHIKLRTS